MAKVRYTIRLYCLHDMDLITFVLTHEFDILHAIYSSVTAFEKGESFIIKIPPATNNELPQLRRVYTKNLVLDSDKDAAAIEMIKKITPGKRNNFFKNLLRLYLVYPFSEEFFENKADVAYFEEKLKPFRTGQREVRAGKVKTTSQKTASSEIATVPEKKELSSFSDQPTQSVENTESNVTSDLPNPIHQEDYAETTDYSAPPEDIDDIMNILDALTQD